MNYSTYIKWRELLFDKTAAGQVHLTLNRDFACNRKTFLLIDLNFHRSIRFENNFSFETKNCMILGVSKVKFMHIRLGRQNLDYNISDAIESLYWTLLGASSTVQPVFQKPLLNQV